MIRQAKQITILSAHLCAILFSFLASGTLTAEDFPMRARASSGIPDREYLLYSIYDHGDKQREFRMVTVFEGKNEAKAYLDLRALDSLEPPPTHYRDYPSYSIVDLQRASMLKLHMDDYAYRVKQKKEEGPFESDITIKGSEFRKVTRAWDGHEIHEETTTVKDLDPRFPAWSIEAFALWGGRVLDWSDGGSILAIVPVQKRPMKSYLVQEGEEVLKTPAGTFQTTKLRWRVSNFFLDLLLKVFTDSLVMWVEKGGSHRIVKMTMPGDQTWILQKATTAL